MRTPYLKTRIVLPVALGLFGLAAAMAAGVGWFERRGIDADLSRTLTGAQATLKARLESDGAAMAAALPFVCDDRKATEAFLSRNRLRLHGVGEPLLDRFKKEHVASELTFLDANLTTVYQAHDVQGASERVNHPAALTALRSARPATGLELDKTGALVLRTVRPWTVGGSIVGYVEAGRGVQEIMRDVRESQGVDVYALVDRPAAPGAADRVGQMLSASAGATTQPGRETIFSDQGTPASTELKAFVADHAPEAEAAVAGEFSADGKRYHGGFVPLLDATGKRIGRLMVVRDTTAAADDARLLSRAVAGLSAVAAALLSVLLYGPVHRIYRRLRTTQEQLLSQTNHDVLTGLPTRRAFLAHLEGVIRERAKAGRTFALLYLDFDRFKLVNDCAGHEVGDMLLQQVATRVRKALSLSKVGGLCTAGRLGADEFGILVDPLADTAEAETLAQQVLDTLAEPLTLKGHEVVCTASIGITTSQLSTGTADEVLRDAHAAFLRAQAGGGRGRFEMFETSMRTSSTNRLELERDLARGIARGELRLFYQPIVRMDDGKLVGFEGLVRWQHPTKGMVSPGDFIPLAEETGLVLPLGMWVLEEGCRQLREWRNGYPELNLTMSLNVSRKQLCFPDLVQRTEKILVDNALPAASLKLEITESTVMEHGTKAIGVLQALRALGTQLLMDDFGTGYSSLSCLHRFPLDGIKVDRAFIRNVSERQDYTAVVQAIVALSRKLGMYVIAEGIETQDQVAMLKGIDPDLLGQGYLFSKPIEAKAAEKFIQQHTPLSKAA